MDFIKIAVITNSMNNFNKKNFIIKIIILKKIIIGDVDFEYFIMIILLNFMRCLNAVNYF